MNISNFSFSGGGASGGGAFFNPCYGSFYDTTTQSPAINTIVPMQLNSTDLTATSGVSVVNNLSGKPTRITPTLSGIYNLQFSAQLDRTGGGSSADIEIWININGTPVPYTNTRVRMQSNARYLVASWNWYFRLIFGQYVEIMWVQDDAVFLFHQIAGIYPAIPSVIATIQKIN